MFPLLLVCLLSFFSAFGVTCPLKKSTVCDFFLPGTKLLVIVTFLRRFHDTFFAPIGLCVMCVMLFVLHYLVLSHSSLGTEPHVTHPVFTAFKKREFGGKSSTEEKRLPHSSTGFTVDFVPHNYPLAKLTWPGLTLRLDLNVLPRTQLWKD
jgi:hypothetical protein